MTNPTSAARSSTGFRERLVPGPWLFIMLLLIVPAAWLTVTPVAAELAVPVAIAAYVIIAGILLLSAPVVSVSDGHLSAGRARIPLSMLGSVEVLDDSGLRAAIGPGMDARSHLVIRGYIHRGVRIEITDPADPTPFWIITSRKPRSLQAAILAGRDPEG